MIQSTIYKRFLSTQAETYRSQLDSFLRYHKTEKSLKPLIYRPKNASKLLTMDMKDPKTHELLKPLPAISTLSKSVLVSYVDCMEFGDRAVLLKWFHEWVSVTPRKKLLWKYLDSSLISKLMYSSFFKIGGYTQLINMLYNNRVKFITAKNSAVFDIEGYFNTWMMCNLHRNQLMKFEDMELLRKKLMNAWRKVAHIERRTGLHLLLMDAWEKQMGYNPKDILKNVPEFKLKLPSLEKVSEEPITEVSMEKFVKDNERNYVLSRTILDFNPVEKDNMVLNKFIKEYQTYSAEVNGTTKDIYDEYTKSMGKIWEPKEEEKETRNNDESNNEQQEGETGEEKVDNSNA
ncbi:mitochondrial 37S ribosomal protein mS44 MRP13 NDAI_0G01440 [Naumovozyma dairenensis CBS 421]|uniref:Uncharacterized protein n=1 Tax=Naumovozyma dairenensis (strain ATCC 10597 / BCRC 20456 / CBS 421 / NBRC 0211 / NRRL Y-12639) TaxID=1071378 RepID=G0WDQ9_NAUDC|nr:hypothetical protein NDAI_0G01440 [Naumovozyma dairenensis CBS 421]CCD25920.2 hypothetical protein NDAI_0G01440 [Naumovozyma dairenensis CBS 421]